MNKLRSVRNLFSRFIHHPAVPHALRNHQPVNSVGCQVFHVTIQQTCALSVQNPVAISNNRPHRCPRARHGLFPNAIECRAQIRVTLAMRVSSIQLVRIRKLLNRDLVLVRMSRPRSIHAANCLVLFVFLKYIEGPRIEFRVCPARI